MLKRVRVHLLLFVATVVTTFGVFFWLWTPDSLALSDRAESAGLFSFCVLLILGCHEMGHYLMARHHQVDASLPYFIPFPIGFGTMGAVIRIRSRIPDRNALVDIGAAGPLAGLLIAIPLYVVGMKLSPVMAAPPAPQLLNGPMALPSLVGQLLDLIELPDGRFTYFGDNLLTLGLQKLFIGPLPPGHDFNDHPVKVAAWFGMLMTMLNLLPIGQLDGGHLTHAWFGPRAIGIGKAVAWLLVALIVFVSWSWVVWLLVTTKLVGFRHPEVILPDEELSAGRKLVCAVCFLFSILTLMPMAISSGA